MLITDLRCIRMNFSQATEKDNETEKPTPNRIILFLTPHEYYYISLCNRTIRVLLIVIAILILWTLLSRLSIRNFDIRRVTIQWWKIIKQMHPMYEINRNLGSSFVACISPLRKSKVPPSFQSRWTRTSAIIEEPHGQVSFGRQVETAVDENIFPFFL